MDETTIQDIRQRVTRWKKEEKTSGKESERTWIFAVNVDDVELMLGEIERLEKENAELQEMANDQAMDAAVDAAEVRKWLDEHFEELSKEDRRFLAKSKRKGRKP